MESNEYSQHMWKGLMSLLTMQSMVPHGPQVIVTSNLEIFMLSASILPLASKKFRPGALNCQFHSDEWVGVPSNCADIWGVELGVCFLIFMYIFSSIFHIEFTTFLKFFQHPAQHATLILLLAFELACDRTLARDFNFPNPDHSWGFWRDENTKWPSGWCPFNHFPVGLKVPEFHHDFFHTKEAVGFWLCSLSETGRFVLWKTLAHQPSWHRNSNCWRAGVAPWTWKFPKIPLVLRHLYHLSIKIPPAFNFVSTFKLSSRHLSLQWWMCEKNGYLRGEGWFLYFHFRDDERRAKWSISGGKHQVTQ